MTCGLWPDSDLMAQALEIGPFARMSKPVDLAQIQQTVHQIVGTARTVA